MFRAFRSPARAVRAALRSAGFDIVRYPPFGGDLVALMDARRVDCVLDVGAFHGTFGRMLRDLGYDKRIVSFEPAAANFEILAREADSDGLWDVFALAVGSRTGTLDLLLTGSPGCNSFLEPNSFARTELPRMFNRRGVESVQVTTIDAVFELVAAEARSVFLKVDAQGFDLEVIRGATTSLSRVAMLQVELALEATYEGQPTYLDVLADLAERGFAPAQLYPTYRDSAGRIAECDCVLVPLETPSSEAPAKP